MPLHRCHYGGHRPQPAFQCKFSGGCSTSTDPEYSSQSWFHKCLPVCNGWLWAWYKVRKCLWRLFFNQSNIFLYPDHYFFLLNFQDYHVYVLWWPILCWECPGSIIESPVLLSKWWTQYYTRNLSWGLQTEGWSYYFFIPWCKCISWWPSSWIYFSILNKTKSITGHFKVSLFVVLF